MKKYLIGIFIGAFLATAGSVFADDIKTSVVDMIGKTVQGSFPIEINGQKAEKDAIVVDNTSYIPVRSAGELFGYDVSFVDSQVILKAKDGVVNLDKLAQAQQDAKAAAKAKFDKDKADNLAQITMEIDADNATKAKLEADRLEAQKIKADKLKAQEDAANQSYSTSPIHSPEPTPAQ